MHLAAISGSVDCIKYLLHRKSPLDIQDAASMTPLHYAGIFLVILSFILRCGLSYLRTPTTLNSFSFKGTAEIRLVIR